MAGSVACQVLAVPEMTLKQIDAATKKRGVSRSFFFVHIAQNVIRSNIVFGVLCIRSIRGRSNSSQCIYTFMTFIDPARAIGDISLAEWFLAPKLNG